MFALITEVLNMRKVWKLQDAKAQFSRVVENALTREPQIVTRRGSKAVVILPVSQYEQLISGKPPFRQFLLECPGMDIRNGSDARTDSPGDLKT
jgi:antitoxin Phd